MRIVHPHHPLTGQRVRVVQHKGTAATAQWVIQLDDQTHACIPDSWAVPDDDSASSPIPDAFTQDLRADVTGLLELARMVQHLCAIQPIEEESDETTPQDTPGGDNAAPPTPDTALLALAVTRTPAGSDQRTGGHDGQAAAGATAATGGR